MAPATQEMDITCVICGNRTTKHHLGIDACRACASFYRRAKVRTGSEYQCRNGTKRCTIGKGDSCKSCRLEKIRELVDRPPMPCDGTPSSSCATLCLIDGFSNSLQRSCEFAMSSLHSFTYLSQRTRTAPYSRSPSEQLRNALPSPDHGRADVAATDQLNCRHCMLYQADLTAFGGGLRQPKLLECTREMYELTTRAMMNALMDFSEAAVIEFSYLPTEEKDKFVKQFHGTYNFFEGIYRSVQHFPEKENLIFFSYTAYVDMQNPKKYFGKAEDQANRIVAESMQDHALKCRRAVSEAALNDVEFIAALGLILFSSENASYSEQLFSITEKNREELMKDLHVYYREVLSCEDYASRLGQIFLLINSLTTPQHRIRENMAMLLLLDAVKSDDYTYQLHCCQ